MYTKENLAEKLNTVDVSRLGELASKKVLLRACLNVVLDKAGNITDRTRLDEAYPTIKFLAENAQKLIVTAHLGRPVDKDPSLSLVKVFDILQEKLQADLGITAVFVDTLQAAKDATAKVVILENIRYFPEEESADKAEQDSFAIKLAELADIFVNDAFPDYRESVSTYFVAQKMPAYLGPLFVKEVNSLAKLANPDKPFIAILGGAKLSEKLDTMLELVKYADKIIIGGAMAYTLLKAQGVSIGKSLFEEDKLPVAKEMLEKFADKLVLPSDHLIASGFSPEAADSAQNTPSVEIPDDTIAIDIGQKTISEFCSYLGNAATILVNGPMGVFEWLPSMKGTQEVYKAVVANTSAFKLIGGGDSISAINKMSITGFNHISTGGGAMLAFIAKNKFPTLDVVLDK
jgi:3-phosphoglycerate kinase